MKKNLFGLIFISLFGIHNIQAKISAIFIDVTAVFETNSFRASGYVGKINSLHYIASVGHKPNQQDLFKELKPIKAKSTQITYNENLEMPLIFSDWLAAVEQNTKLKDTIQKYLNNKNISDIEKKVLFAIVSMMLTPQHLADVQDVNKNVKKVLEKLKNGGVKIFLTGNWAHIASLRSEFPDLFKLFNGVFVSGDLHLLKPSEQFYNTVLSKSGINKENTVWIETESKFAAMAKQFGFNVVHYNLSGNINTLIDGLHKFGLNA